MPNDTLTLLQAKLRKTGRNLTAISPVAADLCEIIDHWNSLHWQDRNLATERLKKLESRLFRLETKGQGE